MNLENIVFFIILSEKNDILIFHFFKKKTQVTPKKEIDLAKKRLETMKGKYL